MRDVGVVCGRCACSRFAASIPAAGACGAFAGMAGLERPTSRERLDVAPSMFGSVSFPHSFWRRCLSVRSRTLLKRGWFSRAAPKRLGSSPTRPLVKLVSSGRRGGDPLVTRCATSTRAPLIVHLGVGPVALQAPRSSPLDSACRACLVSPAPAVFGPLRRRAPGVARLPELQGVASVAVDDAHADNSRRGWEGVGEDGEEREDGKKVGGSTPGVGSSGASACLAALLGAPPGVRASRSTSH